MTSEINTHNMAAGSGHTGGFHNNMATSAMAPYPGNFSINMSKGFLGATNPNMFMKNFPSAESIGDHGTAPIIQNTIGDKVNQESNFQRLIKPFSLPNNKDAAKSLNMGMLSFVFRGRTDDHSYDPHRPVVRDDIQAPLPVINAMLMDAAASDGSDDVSPYDAFNMWGFDGAIANDMLDGNAERVSDYPVTTVTQQGRAQVFDLWGHGSNVGRTRLYIIVKKYDIAHAETHNVNYTEEGRNTKRTRQERLVTQFRPWASVTQGRPQMKDLKYVEEGVTKYGFYYLVGVVYHPPMRPDEYRWDTTTDDYVREQTSVDLSYMVRREQIIIHVNRDSEVRF